jgi:V/A-type H+-transporting ATPase subunit G/H
MSRAEILTGIKQAEEEAKNLVLRSNEEKVRKISEARAQSREIIKKAEDDASKNSASEISKVRESAKIERDKVVEKGKKEADEVKSKARKNVAKANKLILAEFERVINA